LFLLRRWRWPCGGQLARKRDGPRWPGAAGAAGGSGQHSPKRRRPGQGKGASEPAAGPGNEACAPPKCLSPDEGRPPILAAAGARGADNTLTTPGEVRFGAGRPTGPLQLLAYTAPRRSPVMASMSSRSMSACPPCQGGFSALWISTDRRDAAFPCQATQVSSVPSSSAGRLAAACAGPKNAGCAQSFRLDPVPMPGLSSRWSRGSGSVEPDV
jgi:hypothetical protein